MAQQGKQIPVTIQYGIDPEGMIIMQFSMPLQANRMSVEQCRAMIAQLQECIQMSENRKAQAN